MTFYLLFLFLAVLILLVGKYYNYTKEALIALFTLAVLLSGFRDNIGADFNSYVQWYLLKTRDYDIEFGYLVAMKIFRFFNFNYHILFFVFSFVTLFFVFLGVKKHTINASFAFFYYLLIPVLFLGSLNMIRQAFAVAISFYAFHFLIHKKYLYYVLLMGIGMSVHYTAVVPFFIFVIVYKIADRIKTIHLAILLFLSLILSQLNWFSVIKPFFVNTHYVYYFTTEQLPLNVFKILVRNSVALFLLFYYDRMKAAYPNQKYFIVLSFLSIIIVNIFAKYVGLIRISHYFVIFQIIVFADVIFLEIRKRRLLLFVGIFSYGFSLFIHSLRVDSQTELNGLNYIPYNSVFYRFDDPFFMMGTDFLLDPAIDKVPK
jgi:hypothetical protein